MKAGLIVLEPPFSTENYKQQGVAGAIAAGVEIGKVIAHPDHPVAHVLTAINGAEAVCEHGITGAPADKARGAITVTTAGYLVDSRYGQCREQTTAERVADRYGTCWRNDDNRHISFDLAIPYATDAPGPITITRRGEAVAVVIGARQWAVIERMLISPPLPEYRNGDLRIRHGGFRLRVRTESEGAEVLEAMGDADRLELDRGIETFWDHEWGLSCEHEDWAEGK